MKSQCHVSTTWWLIPVCWCVRGRGPEVKSGLLTALTPEGDILHVGLSLQTVWLTVRAPQGTPQRPS